MALLVLDNGRGETSGSAGLARCVHCPWAELLRLSSDRRWGNHTRTRTQTLQLAWIVINCHAQILTHLRNWLLAVLGSPTMHTLMSPRRRVPSVVTFGTPPNNINMTPLFTSSLPVVCMDIHYTRRRKYCVFDHDSWVFVLPIEWYPESIPKLSWEYPEGILTVPWEYPNSILTVYGGK